MFMLFYYYT